MFDIVIWLLIRLFGLCIVLLIVGVLLLKYVFFGFPVFCRSDVSMKGKTVIITGANTGIGKETAANLARRGARVIMACRSEIRAKPAVQEVRARSGNKEVIYEHLDLTNMQSVRDFAERIIKQESQLDVLINNAGLAFHKGKKTKDGFDLVFCSNYLGHFMLTELLLPLLQKSAHSRIINVSSRMHRWASGLDFNKYNGKYKRLSRYERSKLAQILQCRELTHRLKGTGVTANSLDPGPVMTDIWMNMESMFPAWLCVALRRLLKFMFWDVEAGAQTTIYLAVEEAVSEISGKYFEKCAVGKESSYACDDDLANKLVAVSREMVGLKQ